MGWVVVSGWILILCLSMSLLVSTFLVANLDWELRRSAIGWREKLKLFYANYALNYSFNGYCVYLVIDHGASLGAFLVYSLPCVLPQAGLLVALEFRLKRLLRDRL